MFPLIKLIAVFVFIMGGVSLGPNATHPAWAFMAIYVIYFSAFLGPRIVANEKNTATAALLLGWLVGLPLMAAQWLLTH